MDSRSGLQAEMERNRETMTRTRNGEDVQIKIPSLKNLTWSRRAVAEGEVQLLVFDPPSKTGLF